MDEKVIESREYLMKLYKGVYEENRRLKEKINTYENPEDLTLMFMYCDEKAKDKIKQLKEVIEEVREVINKMVHYGYGKNGTYYMRTTDNSEFGARAEVLLQILDKVKIGDKQ